MILTFKDWKLEVDQMLTRQEYAKILASGADTCTCLDCKNYVAFRKQVFPEEIKQLFDTLGIDYKKEVEVVSYGKSVSGLHQIGGWFHFKGAILENKRIGVQLPGGGRVPDFLEITADFGIGFTENNTLTLFEVQENLVELEFNTNIPWVLDKALETE